jgi:hypothetical protein
VKQKASFITLGFLVSFSALVYVGCVAEGDPTATELCQAVYPASDPSDTRGETHSSDEISLTDLNRCLLTTVPRAYRDFQGAKRWACLRGVRLREQVRRMAPSNATCCAASPQTSRNEGETLTDSQRACTAAFEVGHAETRSPQDLAHCSDLLLDLYTACVDGFELGDQPTRRRP